MLSFSYSFVYFYLFGLHENLKARIQGITLNTCYTTALHQITTSAYYYIILLHQLDISVVLHQTIASAYYIRLIASTPSTTNHLITWLFIVKSMVEVLDFLLTKVTVLICTYETSVIQTNYLYWVLIINGVPHNLMCLR